MLYFAGSMVLGILGATGMLIALRGHLRAAAWWLLVTTPPAVVYDIVTRQYGYLILGAMSVSMAVSTLRRTPVAGSPAGSHKPGALSFDGRAGTDHPYYERATKR